MSPLQLREELLIGSGLHRRCYQDPLNPERCIKVIVHGDGVETRREQQFYQHAQARNIPWTSVPRFHGTVQTNLGEGAIFDLVRDDDGNVSRPLEDCLSVPRRCPDERQLKPALQKLREFLLENAILTMTIKPANILIQRRNGKIDRLVIVDNLGCSEFIPLSSHFRILARLKTARRFSRFEAKFWDRYWKRSSAGFDNINPESAQPFSVGSDRSGVYKAPHGT